MIKNKVEIVFNDEIIDIQEGFVNLRKGDKFYLSFHGTTPSSVNKYKLEMIEWPKKLTEDFIEKIEADCEKNHIYLFKVVKVVGSYRKDYSWSISDPKIEYCQCITVKEAFELKDLFREIKMLFGYLPYGKSKFRNFFKELFKKRNFKDFFKKTLKIR